MAKISECRKGNAIMRHCHLCRRSHLMSRADPASNEVRGRNTSPGGESIEVTYVRIVGALS